MQAVSRLLARGPSWAHVLHLRNQPCLSRSPRRGESKPTNLLLKRTLRPGSSGISIPLCRSSWASIADYRANPGRSCAGIRSKERGACHPTRFPLRTSSCGVNRFASLDRSTSLALLHACLFALSASLFELTESGTSLKGAFLRSVGSVLHSIEARRKATQQVL